MVAGSLSAHQLSYWLVVPSAYERSRLLAETGHAYWQHVPLLAAVLAAALGVGLVLRMAGSWRRPYSPRPCAWPFLLLPLLAFALQEHLERILEAGSFPWDAGLEPTFLVGLALQLPFALAAYLCARALLRIAEQLGRALCSRQGSPRPRGLHQPVLPTVAALVTVVGLASGHAQRAPPLLVG
jgi:hypothetical protein